MRPLGHRPREPESLSAMITYLLKSALVLTALYLLYSLTLRGKTLHRTGRLTLLATLAASLLLPVVPLRLPFATWAGTALGEIAAWERAGAVKEVRSAAGWVAGGYLAVAGLLLLHYVLSLLHVAVVVRNGRLLRRVRRVRILTHHALRAPASWLRWVLIDRGNYPPLPLAIVRHELAHIRLGHSLDRILCDLVARVLWFCPFAWLLRRELICLHEFEADARVVAHGISRKAYSRLLVAQADDCPTLPRRLRPLSAFPAWQAGEVRRRLCMLYAAPTPPHVALRALLMLPLGLGLAFVLAQPDEKEFLCENEIETAHRLLAQAAKPSSPMPEPQPAAAKAGTPRKAHGHPSAKAPKRRAARNGADAAPRPGTRKEAAPAAALSPQQVARQMGLEHPESYVAAAAYLPEADSAEVPTVYLVDGLRVSRERFAHYATLCTDPEGRHWALATARAATLSVTPRELAMEDYGVDAHVFSLQTNPLPPEETQAMHMELHMHTSPGLNEVVLVSQDARGNTMYHYLR